MLFNLFQLFVEIFTLCIVLSSLNILMVIWNFLSNNLHICFIRVNFLEFYLVLCLAFVAQFHFPLFCVDICALQKNCHLFQSSHIGHMQKTFTKDLARVSVGLSSLHANPNCYHCSQWLPDLAYDEFHQCYTLGWVGAILRVLVFQRKPPPLFSAALEYAGCHQCSKTEVTHGATPEKFESLISSPTLFLPRKKQETGVSLIIWHCAQNRGYGEKVPLVFLRVLMCLGCRSLSTSFSTSHKRNLLLSQCVHEGKGSPGLPILPSCQCQPQWGFESRYCYNQRDGF